MFPGKVYRPEDLLKAAWRRHWLILVPFVLIASATVFGGRMLQDRYRSETVILVVPQRVPESYVRSTVTARIEDRLQSISQQILSRTRLERIISDFNLYASRQRTDIMEDIVEGMRKDIDVQIVKNDAFKVSYVSNDPQTAMKVTERLASLFIEENLRDREGLAEGTNQFLEAQLDDARRRLVEHEQKLEAYRVAHSGELPSQLNANMQTVHNTEMQVEAVVESINRDHDRRAMIERLLADATASLNASAVSAAPSSGQDESPATVSQQLAASRKLLAELQMRFTSEHPDVVRVKRVVADLEAKAEAEAARAPLSPMPPGASPGAAARDTRAREIQRELENLDRQIAGKQGEERRLRAVIAQYQRRIEAAPKREAELAELTRDYETLQQIYRSMLEKKEESKVAANLERRQIGERFRILDPARLPEKPFSPNRLRINLIGIGVALALGVALAALMEYHDSSLRNEEDVLVALKLPVLALVPVMWTSAELQSKRQKNWIMSGAAAVFLVACAAVAYKLYR